MRKQQFANKPLEYLIESVEQLDNSALTPENNQKNYGNQKSLYQILYVEYTEYT